MAENRVNATSEQIEKLISLVASNKQIVTRRSLGTAKYWNAVANELNALGPPIHNRKEWKELWDDYCGTLKDQLVDNYVKNKDAGKYPWDLANFTPLEKRVIDMIHNHLSHLYRQNLNLSRKRRQLSAVLEIVVTDIEV
uniref:Uncharacterized protein n=1 Tax=Anopheles melas TaxID=34690 RepID=A0A182THF3_9DIPT